MMLRLFVRLSVCHKQIIKLLETFFCNMTDGREISPNLVELMHICTIQYLLFRQVLSVEGNMEGYIVKT